MRLNLVVTSLLLGSLSFGANTSTTTAQKNANQLNLQVGAGLLATEGSALPGAAVSLTNSLAAVPNFSFGWETGGYQQSEGTAYTLVPMMAKANLTFQTAEKIQTTLGLATGVMFATASADTARFALLFEPGVNIALAKNVSLAVLPKFGVMSAKMLFNPELGVLLPL